jgi:hypothetical protein
VGSLKTKGASYFSTLFIFIMCLAVVIGLTDPNNTSALQQFINERLNLTNYILNFFSNPINLVFATVALGIGLATGNTALIAAPIILMILNFIAPIGSMLNSILLPNSTGDPALGLINSFIYAVFNGMLLLSAIIVFRGLFDF